MQALVPAPGSLGGPDLLIGQEEAAVPEADKDQHRQWQQQRLTRHAVAANTGRGGDNPADEYPQPVDMGLPDYRRVPGMLGRHPDPEGHGRAGDRGQHQSEQEHQS